MTDIVWDGKNWYSVGFGNYVATDVSNLSRSRPDLVIEKRVDLAPLKPLSITYNSLANSLMILASDCEKVRTYEYNKDLALVAAHDMPTASKCLVWDPVRYCYWVANYSANLVQKLDEKFQVVESFQVDVPDRISVVGSELFVLRESWFQRRTEVVVFDIANHKQHDHK